MSRIPIPASIVVLSVASQPPLKGVERPLGILPNRFRPAARDHAALEAHLGMLGALWKSAVSAATSQRTALAVAEEREIDGVRVDSYDEAHVVEIVMRVALKIRTNTLSEFAQTDVASPDNSNQWFRSCGNGHPGLSELGR